MEIGWSLTRNHSYRSSLAASATVTGGVLFVLRICMITPSALSLCLSLSLSFILDTRSFPCVLLYVYLCPRSVGAQIPAFRHPHPRVVAGVPYTRTETGEQRG